VAEATGCNDHQWWGAIVRGDGCGSGESRAGDAIEERAAEQNAVYRGTQVV
jgi:hypothetical protein